MLYDQKGVAIQCGRVIRRSRRHKRAPYRLCQPHCGIPQATSAEKALLLWVSLADSVAASHNTPCVIYLNLITTCGSQTLKTVGQKFGLLSERQKKKQARALNPRIHADTVRRSAISSPKGQGKKHLPAAFIVRGGPYFKKKKYELALSRTLMYSACRCFHGRPINRENKAHV